MSHFTVLVLGDDIDEALAPFDENLVVERYLDSVDGDAGRALERSMEYFAKHTDTDTTGWTNKRYLDEYFGPDYWTVSADGEQFEHWSTYNPKSKWDWYVPGGRWDMCLETRMGMKTNSCQASDLDPDKVIVTHAVLKDGQWYEQGRMGWWGIIVSDEKQDDVWETEYRKLLRDLPGDTLVTLVDCHI